MGIKRGLSQEGLVEYFFDAQVNPTSSISKFWFEVDERDGSRPIRVDNDGEGLVIDQDTILFDPGRSSFFGAGDDTPMVNIVVAVSHIQPTKELWGLILLLFSVAHEC